MKVRGGRTWSSRVIYFQKLPRRELRMVLAASAVWIKAMEGQRDEATAYHEAGHEAVTLALGRQGHDGCCRQGRM